MQRQHGGAQDKNDSADVTLPIDFSVYPFVYAQRGLVEAVCLASPRLRSKRPCDEVTEFGKLGNFNEFFDGGRHLCGKVETAS